MCLGSHKVKSGSGSKDLSKLFDTARSESDLFAICKVEICALPSCVQSSEVRVQRFKRHWHYVTLAMRYYHIYVNPLVCKDLVWVCVQHFANWATS